MILAGLQVFSMRKIFEAGHFFHFLVGRFQWPAAFFARPAGLIDRGEAAPNWLVGWYLVEAIMSPSLGSVVYLRSGFVRDCRDRFVFFFCADNLIQGA